MARLIIHRYAMLGVLTEEGFPLRDMGCSNRRSYRLSGAAP